jgi:hypothetical protein
LIYKTPLFFNKYRDRESQEAKKVNFLIIPFAAMRKFLGGQAWLIRFYMLRTNDQGRKN